MSDFDLVSVARLGHAVIDFERRVVCWSQKRRSALSETESALLRFLVTYRQRAVTRHELLSRIWGIGDGLETRTIDMHVARLRHKLRDPIGKDTPDAIVTVRSKGYMASPDLLPLQLSAANGNAS